MKYSPTTSELARLDNMGDEELMQYAVTRIVECEEVWSFGNDDGWLIRDVAEKSVITIWPYLQLAEQLSEQTEYGQSTPISTSLEQFISSVLKQCINTEIIVELCPGAQRVGTFMTAAALLEVLDSLIETGEYFLEG